jgi:hypothetical protein
MGCFHILVVTLNQCYENHWIGRGGPIPWPPRSLDLTSLDFFLWGPMKEITHKTKVHTREGLLNLIMDAADCIQEQPKIIQRAVNSCSEWARQWIETVVNILNSYKMYLIKCSNKFNWLIPLFIFLCTHLHTATAMQQFKIGSMVY